MSMTNILIIMTIFALIITVVASGVAIFVFFKNRAYLRKILEYHDGLANIQGRLKDMFLEHHTLIEQLIIDTREEILRNITYTLRWQKVTAKMVRVGDKMPMAETSVSGDPIKDAEQMHDIGLEIADVAFKSTQELTEIKNEKEK